MKTQHLAFAACFWLNTATLSAQMAAAVGLEKMNVFYLGVNNPMTVVANNVPLQHVHVLVSSGELKKDGVAHYYWHGTGIDTQTVELLVLDTVAHDTVKRYPIRVQEFPEPLPLLGAQKHPRLIPAGQFKAQAGVAMVYTGFDIDAKVNMISYEVYRISKEKGEQVAHNTGARYIPETRQLIEQAEAGDQYIFRNFVYQGFYAGTRTSFAELFFRIK